MREYQKRSYNPTKIQGGQKQKEYQREYREFNKKTNDNFKITKDDKKNVLIDKNKFVDKYVDLESEFIDIIPIKNVKTEIGTQEDYE